MTDVKSKVAPLEAGDVVELDVYRSSVDGPVTERGVLYRHRNGTLLLDSIVVRWGDGQPGAGIMDVRVVPPVDPGCPFPMGSLVRVESDDSETNGTVGFVTDWFWSKVDQLWFVRLNNEVGFNGRPTGWEPSMLRTVPREEYREAVGGIPMPVPMSFGDADRLVRLLNTVAENVESRDEAEFIDRMADLIHAATLVIIPDSSTRPSAWAVGDDLTLRFHVGDRVRVVMPFRRTTGLVGTVTEVAPSDAVPYLVVLDEDPDVSVVSRCYEDGDLEFALSG